ncbi:hypothetical protein RBB50_003874 [Rhinocladiella similis]
MLPKNAVWFITGCSHGGIGASIAQYALSQGHRVVATARKTTALSDLTDNPDTTLKLQLDVCSVESIDTALAVTLAKFGRIDVVVNNAGINTVGITEALTEESMRAVMETNFWGPMHLTRKAIAIFRDVNPKSGGIGGTVVNVSTIGGRFALPAEAPYHASKFALEGFSEGIASEMAPDWKIRVLILEPGGTKTRFIDNSRANTGPSHPAYSDPSLPVNLMLGALANPALNDGLVDPIEVAKCLFNTLQKDSIPLRLPTGPDAYTMIKAKETAKLDELEKWREVSLSVGGGGIPTTISEL